jgi:CBS domain-containing protein
MLESGRTRVLVTEGDRLVGIISLSDLRRILGLRIDFLDTMRAAEPKVA